MSWPVSSLAASFRMVYQSVLLHEPAQPWGVGGPSGKTKNFLVGLKCISIELPGTAAKAASRDTTEAGQSLFKDRVVEVILDSGSHPGI